MLRPSPRPLLAIAVLMSCAASAAVALGSSPDLLLAVPVLVVALPLLAGRYVGEERIARLRAAAVRPRPRPRFVVPSTAAAARATRALVPRGGRLIAASLAVRPPPALLPVT